MRDIVDTILLLALPASGKSEVRKYLASLSPEECQRDFHMGPTVQLDDFPYVHLMRRIDDELEAMQQPRIFFASADKPFLSTKDWGTLIQLINEDYQDLVNKNRVKSTSASAWLFDRLDRAAQKCDLPPRLAKLNGKIHSSLETRLEKEARDFLEQKIAGIPDSLEGKTLVIEFARGGPQGSPMPLPREYGYSYSLGKLSAEILKRASILYLWVTPEESRRKNDARADPNDPGSILHHGVPLAVMLGDYGCDDMDYLEKIAEKPGCVTVKQDGKSYNLPVGRLDNRVDKTSFIRNPTSSWNPADVDAIRKEIKQAMDKLAQA